MAKRNRVSLGSGSTSVTLYRGDCLELLSELPAVDAVITDPPYGIGYTLGAGGKGLASRKNHSQPIAGDDRPFDPSPWLAWPCLFWGANHFAPRLPAGGSWIAWDKSCGKGPADSFVDCDFAWTSRRSVKRNICRYLWKGIACVKAGEERGRRYHPAHKPVGLMRWCLETLDLTPGMTVLDPFMGSGSTGLAALELGIHFVGVEIDPGHFDIAGRRIQTALQRLAA